MPDPVQAFDFTPDHQFANFPLDGIGQSVEDKLFVDTCDQLGTSDAVINLPSLLTKKPTSTQIGTQSLFRAGHRATFIENVTDDLKRLHEGVLARYGLRPSEFKAWRSHRK